MKSKLFIIFGLMGVAILPAVALAGGGQGFTPLVGIPGLPSDGSFDGYVDALYALAISIAALVAVVKIVLAGAKYMMDDIVTHKSEAKQDIKNALIGLLIIIGAVIILNTINSDLTNLAITADPVLLDNTRPNPIQQINLIEDAISRNSPWVKNACPGGYGIASEFGITRSCQNECRAISGQFDWGITYHSCSYAQDIADQCNPQQSVLCCETIKGGDWNWDVTSNNCSGMTPEDVLIAQCYSGGNGTWDEVNNTCRTTDCDPNGNSDCCELGYGGTLSGGTCVTAVQSELDCINTNGIWNSQTNTCTPQTVANDETTCEAQGAGFVWRAGSCLEYTNTFPAQIDNCATGDVSCLSSLCQSGGLGIVYIPELQMCGTDPNALN